MNAIETARPLIPLVRMYCTQGTIPAAPLPPNDYVPCNPVMKADEDVMPTTREGMARLTPVLPDSQIDKIDITSIEPVETPMAGSLA